MSYVLNEIAKMGGSILFIRDVCHAKELLVKWKEFLKRSLC